MNEEQLKQDERGLEAAFHESAHAIAVECGGGFVQQIEVNFRTAGGETSYTPTDDLYTNAIACKAGSIASEIFYDRSEGARVRQWLDGERSNHDPAAWGPGTISPSDRKGIDQYLNQWRGFYELQKSKRGELHREAWLFVRQNWEWIDQVVDALIAKVDRDGRAVLGRDDFLSIVNMPNNDPVAQLERRKAGLEGRAAKRQAKEQIGEIRGLLAKNPPYDVKRVLESSLARNMEQARG